MLPKILGIIQETPVWVWFLFGYLLYRGIASLKTRTMSVGRLFLVPTVFLFLSLQNIISRMCSCFTFIVFAAYVLLLILGILLGWLIVKHMTVIVDKKRHLIVLPGSVVMLVLTLLIFGIKYVFGYMKAVHPESMTTTFAVTLYAGVSGMLAGIALGRMFYFLYQYKKSQHIDLA